MIQPGATQYDDEGRIKGNMSFPLSDRGQKQVDQMVKALGNEAFDVVLSAPCESAKETARQIADRTGARWRTADELANLDHGLWHGRLIHEIRRCQPKAYRQWQERSQAVAPPEGEVLGNAQKRVREFLERLLRRRKRGRIALVVPEPLRSIVQHELVRDGLENLWDSECDQGAWVRIRVSEQGHAVLG